MSRWWGLSVATRLKVIWAVVAIVLGSVTASCAGGDYSSAEPQPERFYVSGVRVIDFTTPEGVPCVLGTSPDGVALSCDWGAR